MKSFEALGKLYTGLIVFDEAFDSNIIKRPGLLPELQSLQQHVAFFQRSSPPPSALPLSLTYPLLSSFVFILTLSPSFYNQATNSTQRYTDITVKTIKQCVFSEGNLALLHKPKTGLNQDEPGSKLLYNSNTPKMVHMHTLKQLFKEKNIFIIKIKPYHLMLMDNYVKQTHFHPSDICTHMVLTSHVRHTMHRAVRHEK